MRRLEVWPLKLAFGVDSLDSKGEVLEYKVYDWCNSIFQMGHNTHEWTTYILMPRARAMGMRNLRIKGVYMNSKHRVGGKQTVWNNYYMEKQGQGLMETDSGFWPHHGWGGCPVAH